MKTTYALLVTGLAAQQVAATWNFFDNFKTPLYNNNDCSDKQKAGFDWSGLKDGDKNFQYGDFDFSQGWSCSNSFGKRDLITKRTFGNKVIKNTVRKDKPASFGCSKRKSGFSITDIDVSVDVDVELELHYTMTDGSKCKTYSPCSAGGSTIKNTQCGGATSVDVYLGSHYKGNKSECEIGLHHIGFDCNPGTGYNPPSPPEVPSSSAPSKSQPAISTSHLQPPATPTGGVASPPSCQGRTCYPQSTPEASTSSTTEMCNGSYGEGCNTLIQTPSSDSPSSSLAPYTNSSAPAYTPPTYETTAMPPPSYESSTVTPLPATVSEVSPPTMTSPSSTGVSLPAISTSIAQPSSPSYPPTGISDVLPKCMNSWLQIDSSCKDNTDKSCYCVNSSFTKNVIDCVSSWCGTDAETKQTLQYLIGICAEYVPQNPKIIEDCPSYIPLNPAPATPTPGITGGISTTAAASETPAASLSVPCTTITYGTTSLTVPQVHFTTQTQIAGANPTQPVGLVPGTAPPQIPATTTASAAPYPIPSTLGTQTAPGGTGTGAIRPSSPAEFTGAASSLNVVPHGALFGAALALFAL